MNNLYIIFDKIPQKKEGGLVATYVNLIEELSAHFNIVLVSIFRSDPIDIPQFKNLEILTLFDHPLDNRFYRAISYLRSGETRKFLFALKSCLRFFYCIPAARIKTRKMFAGQMVIAVAPVPAIFLSAHLKYILEIHINFEYFWGTNLLGRAQSALISPPAITVFRNRIDAAKGSKRFPSTYIYNTCSYSNIPSPVLPSRLLHRALFVGRLAEQKNPYMLLECAKLVRKHYPDFVLDIYGDGPLREGLEQHISQESLSEFVRLRGFTDSKAIYQGYDVLWMTSRFEGFGLVIIEAAANMVPTITTNWGAAASEVVLNGKTGYVVNDLAEFVDRNNELMASLDKRNELAENAYEDFYERFSADVHKERWLSLLRSVYGNRANTKD